MCISSVFGAFGVLSVSVLLVGLLQQVGAAAQPACWVEPYLLNCTVYGMNASDPGVTGNLAFPVFYNPILPQRAEAIVGNVRNQLGLAWQKTIPPIDFHMTISYLYCVSVTHTEAIRSALKNFKWKSFEITVDRTICEQGWIEMGVSSQSQVLLGNFSRRIQDHLISAGIPIPNLDDLQPPMHITIGVYNASYPIPGNWYLPAFGSPVKMELDTFYFGETLYLASNFIDGDGGGLSTWIIIILVLIAVILCLLLALYTGCINNWCSRICCLKTWTIV